MFIAKLEGIRVQVLGFRVGLHTSLKSPFWVHGQLLMIS